MAEQPQLNWFKSSYSGTPQNECVECAETAQHILVRDSKSVRGPRCGFSREAWAAFTVAVGSGSLS
ncbi:DUF397 domain-containing protein [Streptomyces millisiae]|uniref:DUF397 domain-containing protein n=1 Tax=Streptomyces millisiae TaxID=3075542 RepID=A0ABU2LXI3_9ACTN|nr:DUF397 domain-containing protein [Streptomyces sp. DSM 44918]MDT0321897.1 DUF397 domain-containing protein [Streptomyces sp. DSM 44918]